SAFQAALGRDATPAEQSYFAPLISGGTMSPYQLQQYAAGTPEAQQAKLAGATRAYANTLGASNNYILGQAANQAQSQFAQAGRQYSTGQGNTILQAGQQLAATQSPS